MENLQETQIVTQKGILSLNIYELPSFKEARDRQEKLIIDNPFIQIIDNKTYEEAKKRRTTLRQGRFELQNGLKVIKDALNTFKSEAENITDELINITKPTENKQQTEVSRYEEEKETEKKRKEEEERQRKETIKKTITDFRNSANQSIASATFNTIEGIQKDITEKNIQCAEFQEDFEAIKTDLVRAVEQKRLQLQETENLRIAQAEITRERARSIELKKYDYIYSGENLGKISETEFLEIRETQRKQYQETQAQKAAKEAAEKAERERIELENKAERENLEAERKAIELEKARIVQEEQEKREKTKIAEQDKIKQKLIEEKAERETAELARQETLKPDKQKMIESLNTLTLPEPELTSDEMNREWGLVTETLRHFIIDQTTIIENL